MSWWRYGRSLQFVMCSDGLFVLLRGSLSVYKLYSAECWMIWHAGLLTEWLKIAPLVSECFDMWSKCCVMWPMSRQLRWWCDAAILNSNLIGVLYSVSKLAKNFRLHPVGKFAENLLCQFWACEVGLAKTWKAIQFRNYATSMHCCLYHDQGKRPNRLSYLCMSTCTHVM